MLQQHLRHLESPDAYLRLHAVHNLGFFREEAGVVVPALVRRVLHDQNPRVRQDAAYVPSVAPLFGEKEGKIARANRGRDPLYLFSALQRQLGYPEVPRPHRPDEAEARLLLLEQRVAHLENRLKVIEAEAQDVDLSQFAVKPEDTAGPPAGWGTHELD